MYGGRFTKDYDSCNKTDLVELVVHITVFTILIVIFFSAEMNKRDATDMSVLEFSILIALGGLIGYILQLTIKISMCAAIK